MPDKKLTDVTDNNVGKMTDSEIVKALECCLETSGVNCGKCLYCDNCITDENTSLMMTDALDLINRLQAENEELKDTVKVLRVGVEQAHIIRKDGKSPFNLLKAEIKAEAYKECIEKVKEKSKKTEIVCSGKLITTNYTISARNFNNLLKELVGEDNA